ncbi:MAG: transglycosylase domain-containing protein [Spirochaetales bacterium]|nr:transglycosylase domain-containing protein [Spirochaetales bacterium]
MRKSKQEDRETTGRYSRYIFEPPGGILSRILFYSWNRLLDKKIRGHSLLKALALNGILVFLCGLFFSATLLDPIMVFLDGGYEEPSIVYGQDRTGQPVPFAEFYRRKRNVVRMGEHIDWNTRAVQSFIAMEDSNFRSHPGLDLPGILRAALVNARAGRVKEGASTITQQVARLRFLSRERNIIRKVREASLALLLEIKLSKARIIELYLNEVPMGHGALGAEAAARFYFEKSLPDLSWGESAVIASLTTRPGELSPLVNRDGSREKVQVVFRKLVERGVLTPAEAAKEYALLESEYYASLNRSPNDSAFHQRLNLHPYAGEYVKSVLPFRFLRKLYSGGLRIYTSINVEHQKAAEEEFIAHLKRLTRERRRPPFRHFDEFDERYGDFMVLARSLFPLYDFSINIGREERQFIRSLNEHGPAGLAALSLIAGNPAMAIRFEDLLQRQSDLMEETLNVEGSLVALRPETGEITAVIGGSGFESRNQLLRFRQARRQPGSSFKPIIYAAGIEYSYRNPDSGKKLTAASLLEDSPRQFVMGDLSEYSAENYTGDYEGPMLLRKALINSRNAVAVAVYEMMGPTRLNATAERILALDETGRRLPPEATVALGSYEVSSLEMARAFATFASGGFRVHPHALLYITNSQGKMLEDFRPSFKAGERILSDSTARIMTSMLEDAVNKGTGQAARLPGRKVAGKTGTTNSAADVWFVGYTPELVAATHIGYDLRRSLGERATGGGLAAPVWARFMQKALAGEKSRSFAFAGAPVETRQICAISGLLPAAHCGERLTEVFAPGTVPEKICDDHRGGDPLPAVPLEMKKPVQILRPDDF